MGGSCGSELMEEGSELLDVDRSCRCWGSGVRSRWCLDEQSTHRHVEGTRTETWVRRCDCESDWSSVYSLSLFLFACLKLGPEMV